MNSIERYVLAFSRVLIAVVFPLNDFGIFSQALAATITRLCLSRNIKPG